MSQTGTVPPEVLPAAMASVLAELRARSTADYVRRISAGHAPAWVERHSFRGRTLSRRRRCAGPEIPHRRIEIIARQLGWPVVYAPGVPEAR